MSDKVSVTCPQCKGSILTTHDALRAAADAGRLVPCGRCAKASHTSRLTAADVTLLAAATVTAATASEIVPRSLLVLQCWHLDAERFGLEGFRKTHLDAKRVDTEIAHLKALGMVERAGPNLCRLTKAGAERVLFLKERK